MNSYKRRSAFIHCLFCLIVTITSFIFPCTCFTADLSKVKRYLLVSDMAKIWDTSIKEASLKVYTDALVKSGKFTQEQLEQETIKMKKIFKKHFSYNSIEPDLEKCLAISLQNTDVDFLIKYELNIIKENPDNESKFQKTLEEVNVCIRTIVRIKLRKLKNAGQI